MGVARGWPALPTRVDGSGSGWQAGVLSGWAGGGSEWLMSPTRWVTSVERCAGRWQGWVVKGGKVAGRVADVTDGRWGERW